MNVAGITWRCGSLPRREGTEYRTMHSRADRYGIKYSEIFAVVDGHLCYAGTERYNPETEQTSYLMPS
jgi:hypothetical protein